MHLARHFGLREKGKEACGSLRRHYPEQVQRVGGVLRAPSQLPVLACQKPVGSPNTTTLSPQESSVKRARRIPAERAHRKNLAEETPGLDPALDNMTQTEKANRFRALHERDGIFLIPNPWDAGSARVLEGLGFEALATSSAAFAATLGRRDGKVTRDEVLAHIRQVVQATNIPVSADLENCFADEPAAVAETIRLAAEAGLAGGSVEDSTHDSTKPLYDFGQATERVAAAVAAARALPFPFTLTARAQNYTRPNPSVDDTIKRLLAYERAGADVLFAPGLPDLASVREVCKAVSKPVNFMVGIKGKSFSVAELAAAGVKRVSFAGALYRAAVTGLVNAAREIKTAGTFNFLEQTMTSADLNPFLAD